MKRFLITALLVVVLLGVIAVRFFRRSHPQGLSVGVVTTQCSSPADRFLGRQVRLRIDDDGSLLINTEPIPAGQLPRLLDGIYRVRNERVLFFDGGNSVSFRQAIATIDNAKSAVPDLKVILITPSTREECQPLWEPIPSVSE
jgi:biopolymer transport protein ExbD